MKDREILASGNVPGDTVHQAELATNDEGGPAWGSMDHYLPLNGKYHQMENWGADAHLVMW